MGMERPLKASVLEVPPVRFSGVAKHLAFASSTPKYRTAVIVKMAQFRNKGHGEWASRHKSGLENPK